MSCQCQVVYNIQIMFFKKLLTFCVLSNKDMLQYMTYYIIRARTSFNPTMFTGMFQTMHLIYTDVLNFLEQGEKPISKYSCITA